MERTQSFATVYLLCVFWPSISDMVHTNCVCIHSCDLNLGFSFKNKVSLVKLYLGFVSLWPWSSPLSYIYTLVLFWSLLVHSFFHVLYYVQAQHINDKTSLNMTDGLWLSKVKCRNNLHCRQRWNTWPLFRYVAIVFILNNLHKPAVRRHVNRKCYFIKLVSIVYLLTTKDVSDMVKIMSIVQSHSTHYLPLIYIIFLFRCHSIYVSRTF